jgi:hypothetical protein
MAEQDAEHDERRQQDQRHDSGRAGGHPDPHLGLVRRCGGQDLVGGKEDADDEGDDQDGDEAPAGLHEDGGPDGPNGRGGEPGREECMPLRGSR